MKKNLLIAIATLLSIYGYSQSLSDKTMTFYGVDYSKAKMIGAEGFSNPADIKGRMFGQWNSLFTVEADKYDLKKTFQKDKVDLDFTSVEKQNASVDEKTLVTNSPYTISDAQAESVLANYDTKGKTGLGLVFVVESYDKTKELGKIHVIFFDNASHKVILHKKFEEKPGGFGVKSYWARPILYTLEDCKSEYKKWLKGK